MDRRDALSSAALDGERRSNRVGMEDGRHRTQTQILPAEERRLKSFEGRTGAMDDRSRNPDEIMEENTPFDLSQRLEEWRSALLRTGALKAEDLEELELHLRDSVGQLELKGLSTEEAFLIATRRAGDSVQLAAEFTKVNRSHIWGSRLLWMLVGLLVFRSVGIFAFFPVQVLLFLRDRLALTQTWAAIVCFAAYWVVIGIVCWVGWRTMNGPHRVLSRIASACANRPVWASLGLIALSAIANMAGSLFSMAHARYFNISESGGYYRALLTQNIICVTLFQQVLIPILTVYLLRRQWRTRTKTAILP
jgi:hypothetical protein